MEDQPQNTQKLDSSLQSEEQLKINLIDREQIEMDPQTNMQHQQMQGNGNILDNSIETQNKFLHDCINDFEKIEIIDLREIQEEQKEQVNEQIKDRQVVIKKKYQNYDLEELEKLLDNQRENYFKQYECFQDINKEISELIEKISRLNGLGLIKQAELRKEQFKMLLEIRDLENQYIQLKFPSGGFKKQNTLKQRDELRSEIVALQLSLEIETRDEAEEKLESAYIDANYLEANYYPAESIEYIEIQERIVSLLKLLSLYKLVPNEAVLSYDDQYKKQLMRLMKIQGVNSIYEAQQELNKTLVKISNIEEVELKKQKELDSRYTALMRIIELKRYY